MRSLRRALNSLVVSAVVITISACGNLDTPGTKAAIEIPGVTSTSTTNPKIFKISVGSIWETDTSNTVIPQGTCSVEESTPLGEECTITIPEAQLFYAKLRISAEVTNKAKCSIFSFFPYYFQMSNSADFQPAGAYSNFSALDCSANPIPDGCFSGAATKIVPSFKPGQNTGFYLLPDKSSSFDWTVDSPNTLRGQLNYNMGLRWFANNLANTASVGITDYVSSSMVHYRFECEDVYDDEQYSIFLKIAPDPGDGYDFSTTLRW